MSTGFGDSVSDVKQPNLMPIGGTIGNFEWENRFL